jgi:hypothetical protein
VKTIPSLGWVILIGSCSSVAPSPANELYFQRFGPAESHLLHLSADGQFTEFVREHLSVQEGVNGTWAWRSGTELEFLTPWIPCVARGPIRIAPGKDWRTHLSRIRTRIESYLRDHPAVTTFDSDDVEAIVQEQDEEAVRQRYVVQPIVVVAEQVSRAELESLSPAIDEYLLRRNPGGVRARLVEHRGVMFLDLPEGGPYIRQPIAEAVRRLIDENPGEKSMGVYFRISPEEFRSALQTGEPFKFFDRNK